MHSDTVVDELTRLGLTMNEARAYKAMVSLGPSTARQIAEVSGIPRSKVYETLDLLEKRGFANRILGKDPTTFRPSPPKTTINHLMKKMETAGSSVLSALEHLEEEREAEEEEFVWTSQGDDQIIMGIKAAIDKAKKTVFIATRLPSLLSPLRTTFADAKRRGVTIELHTTSLLKDEFEGMKHYMDILGAVPSSEILLESLGQVLMEDSFNSAGWDPDSMSIIVIDGVESVAIFRASSDSRKPWALHIKNPLIVMIQWQVIRSVLSNIEVMIQQARKRGHL